MPIEPNIILLLARCWTSIQRRERPSSSAAESRQLPRRQPRRSAGESQVTITPLDLSDFAAATPRKQGPTFVIHSSVRCHRIRRILALMRSRAGWFLTCCFFVGCSERPTAEADPDAGNAIDAPPGDEDSSRSEDASDDGGSDDVGNPDRCVARAYEGKPLPVDMYLLVDGSEAANCPQGAWCISDGGAPPPGEARWPAVTSAIERFAAAPSGSSVGLSLFPRFSSGGNAVACLADDYAAPDLPFGTSADAFTALLGARKPRGNWLLQAPLEGALRYARTHAEANPDRQTLVALVTHGSDAYACSDDTFATANQLAALAWAATPAVKTAVISLLPNLGALGTLAWAGGSRVYGINRRSPDAGSETVAALEEATAQCTYPVPETLPPARANLLLALQMRLGPAGAFSVIGRFDDAQHCAAGGDGWFFNNNQSPSRVSLCPATCRTMTMTPDSAVRLLVGCLL